MYKIQFLIVLTLLGPVALFAQLTANRQIIPTGSTAKTVAPVNLTNAIQTTRQAVFTAHLLTDQVEPGEKYEYDGLIGGQMVSLPCPIPYQVRNRWQWPNNPSAFRFGEGSCIYVSEPDTDPIGRRRI